MTSPATSPAPNRAAQKIRAWRKRQTPPLTQAEFGRRFGLAGITVSRIERGERLPRLRAAARLEQAGIVETADWTRPPAPSEGPGEEAQEAAGGHAA